MVRLNRVGLTALAWNALALRAGLVRLLRWRPAHRAATGSDLAMMPDSAAPLTVHQPRATSYARHLGQVTPHVTLRWESSAAVRTRSITITGKCCAIGRNEEIRLVGRQGLSLLLHYSLAYDFHSLNRSSICQRNR